MNLQVVCYLFSPHFFLPFLQRLQITRMLQYTCFVKKLTSVAEPKHLTLERALKTSFKTFIVEGLGKYLFINQCN